MYSYIRGTIVDIESNYIVLDNNNIGYTIYVSNPYSYELNKDYIVYIYTKVAEDEYTLYGFKTKESKDLFLKLISVKGLGPKMALPIIEIASGVELMEAIESNDLDYLKKFPKIGEKLAKQMVLDLKGKLIYSDNGSTKHNNYSKELTEVLLGLGYKQGDIKKVLNRLDTSLSLEKQVKEALKLMVK